MFPEEGQASDQQSKDEAECYSWAASNTGSDPFELQKQSEQIHQQTEQQLAEAQSATKGGQAAGERKTTSNARASRQFQEGIQRRP